MHTNSVCRRCFASRDENRKTKTPNGMHWMFSSLSLVIFELLVPKFTGHQPNSLNETKDNHHHFLLPSFCFSFRLCFGGRSLCGAFIYGGLSIRVHDFKTNKSTNNIYFNSQQRAHTRCVRLHETNRISHLIGLHA